MTLHLHTVRRMIRAWRDGEPALEAWNVPYSQILAARNRGERTRGLPVLRFENNSEALQHIVESLIAAREAKGKRPSRAKTMYKVKKFISRVTRRDISHCTECGGLAFTGERERLDRDAQKSLCHVCAAVHSMCARCDNLFSAVNCVTVQLAGGDELTCLCLGCKESQYVRCRDCEFFIYHSDAYNSGTSFQPIWCCTDCFERRQTPSFDMGGRTASRDVMRTNAIGLLMSYSADVTMHMQGPWLHKQGEATDGRGNRKSKYPTLWMGFELECQSRADHNGDAIRGVFTALAGRGIIKSDSSLDGRRGMEIVSLPGTLSYFQTGLGDEFFKPLQEHCIGWSASNAGMHVHVARNALSPLQVARLAIFLNGSLDAEAPRPKDFGHEYFQQILRNPAWPNPYASQLTGASYATIEKWREEAKEYLAASERLKTKRKDVAVDNAQFITQIAGRPPNTYCQIVKKNFSSYSLARTLHITENMHITGTRAQNILYVNRSNNGGASATNMLHVGGRHEALNVTKNHTIEFRLFRSNCAKLGFLKNIEFCHASLMFCAQTSNTRLQYTDFLAWLDANRGAYPNLVRWLVQTGTGQKYLTGKYKDEQAVAA